MEWWYDDDDDDHDDDDDDDDDDDIYFAKGRYTGRAKAHRSWQPYWELLKKKKFKKQKRKTTLQPFRRTCQYTK